MNPLAHTLVRMNIAAHATLGRLRERHGARFRWLVLLTVMVGMMASIMSSTIINVAVPDMSRHFQIGQDRAQWISAAFMASTTLSLLVTPWLLQRYGLRKTCIGANILLMAGGVAGGLSGSYSLIVLTRMLEGVAAGILMPIPNVVIMQEFPSDQQGRAFGVFGFGAVLAPAIGPVIGGVLVEHFGWRSIFFVVVPFCLIAVALARRFLPAVSSLPTAPRPLDWIGLTWAGVATLAVLNGLVELRGDDALRGVFLSGAGIAGFASFALYQARAVNPLLRMRLFLHRPFAMGALAGFFFGIGLFGSTYLLLIYLQAALGMPPSQAGLVMLPAGIALAACMPVSGRLADQLRASRLVAGGFAVLVASLLLMTTVTPHTSYAVLLAWVVMGRVGMGILMPALSLGSLRGLASTEFAQASSISNFLRQLGGAIGVSLIGILLEWRLAAHGVTLLEGGRAARGAAFDEAFLLLAVLCAPAIVAALFMDPTAVFAPEAASGEGRRATPASRK